MLWYVPVYSVRLSFSQNGAAYLCREEVSLTSWAKWANNILLVPALCVAIDFFIVFRLKKCMSECGSWKLHRAKFVLKNWPTHSTFYMYTEVKNNDAILIYLLPVVEIGLQRKIYFINNLVNSSSLMKSPCSVYTAHNEPILTSAYCFL